MKIYKRLFLLSLVCLTSSCGGIDTRGWPHIELAFENFDVLKASVDYTHNKKGWKDENETGYLTIQDEESINSLIFYIKEFAIKKDPESYLDISDFRTRILVTFYYEYSGEIFSNKLSFYSYGVYESKVLLDNGDVHFVPSEIDHLYKKFCNN